MKIGYSNFHKLEVEAYQEFQSLWKVDNPEWVTQRKAAWRAKVGDEGGDPHTRFLGEFYVFGKEPPSYIEHGPLDDREHIRFEFADRLAYTPFENVVQLKRFWQNTVSLYKTNSSQRFTEMEYIESRLESLPERDQKIRLVTETFFTSEYFMIREAEFGRIVTITPDDFVIGFTGLSRFYSKKNQQKWDYRNFCVDYFMMCVRYCDEHNVLDTPRSQEALPYMYETLLKKDDSKLSEYQLRLKQQLIAEAEAEDAPNILKQALIDARENLED